MYCSFIIVKGYKLDVAKRKDVQGEIWNWEGPKYEASLPSRVCYSPGIRDNNIHAVLPTQEAPLHLGTCATFVLKFPYIGMTEFLSLWLNLISNPPLPPPPHWKSGWYHVAPRANTLIILVFLVWPVPTLSPLTSIDCQVWFQEPLSTLNDKDIPITQEIP